MKISELLLKYKTDKNLGIIDREKGHYFGNSYDEIFSWFNRELNLNILEIGVQKGGSLQAWKEYFPNANVTGVDIVDVREKEYISTDLKFILSDIKDVDINKYFLRLGLDIIIDDGSHFLDDVLFVVNNYLQILNYDGVIIVEDTQSPIAWLKGILQIVHNETGCFEVQYRDMREIGHYDDFLIIVRRRNCNGFFKIFIKIKNIIVFRFLLCKDLTLRRIIKGIVRKIGL